MSHRIKANMEELQQEIKKLCEEPIIYRSAERIVTCHEAYKVMCEMYGHREHDHDYDDVYKVDLAVTEGRTPRFDKRMAMEWTAGMVNADGTKGPHWTMEDTNKLHTQHSLTCSKEEFWAVINSLYSDYCEALRESGASTSETYVRLANAWIKDADAVPDKAAAYYTYVVEH